MIESKNTPKKSISKTPLWMIIYSDMMTNLTLFFMLAFALTRIEKNIADDISQMLKAKMAGKDVIANYEITKINEKQFINKIKRGVLRDYADFEINNDAIKILLKEPLLFESGFSEILPRNRETLHKIAVLLKGISNAVIIEGHTDDIPMKKGTNWELSLSRAVNIADYFSDKEGLQRNRFMTMGYGEFKPLVQNTDKDNRAKNRRIEINVMRYERK